MSYAPLDLDTIADLDTMAPRQVQPLAVQVGIDIILASDGATPTRKTLQREIGQRFAAAGRPLQPHQRTRWAAAAIEKFSTDVADQPDLSIESARRTMLGRAARMAKRLELAAEHLLPATPREYVDADSEELRSNITVATKVIQTMVKHDELCATLMHMDKLAPETVLHDAESRDVVLDILDRRMGDFDDEQRARIAVMAPRALKDVDDELDPLRALRLVK